MQVGIVQKKTHDSIRLLEKQEVTSVAFERQYTVYLNFKREERSVQRVVDARLRIG